MVSQKALEGPRGGGPQAFGATPPPVLCLPHTRSSQHLEGCSGHLERQGVAGTDQRWGEDKRWSLSSRSSQLQRTEGYTRQTPPQPGPPNTPFPLLNLHKLHSMYPWFGINCTTPGLGTECGSLILFRMRLEAPRGKGYSKAIFSLQWHLGPHLRRDEGEPVHTGLPEQIADISSRRPSVNVTL